MKTCTKCQRELPATEFYIRRKKAGELHSYCKRCMKAAARDRRLENPMLDAMPLVFSLLKKHGPMSGVVITRLVASLRKEPAHSARMLTWAWRKWAGDKIERSRAMRNVAYIYRVAGDDRPVYEPPYRMRKRMHIIASHQRDVPITAEDESWMREQQERARAREAMRKATSA